MTVCKQSRGKLTSNKKTCALPLALVFLQVMDFADLLKKVIEAGIRKHGSQRLFAEAARIEEASLSRYTSGTIPKADAFVRMVEAADGKIRRALPDYDPRPDALLLVEKDFQQIQQTTLTILRKYQAGDSSPPKADENPSDILAVAEDSPPYPSAPPPAVKRQAGAPKRRPS